MSVSVDNDFARFGAKNYAINKITSVEIREVKDKNAGCTIAIFAVITLVLAVSAFQSFSSGFETVLGFLAGAAIFGYLTYAMIQKSKEITYQLFLITAASEQQAYESKSRENVYDLRDRVEAAMMHHSRGAQ
ncbi:MAG: DUF6232 family protein [Sphingomonas pseudosanguinis]|uniref:DUF6232 family protein n=1 Tax=Sphingomonas pseudosanguinis TaxID=413712 RepID=UPI00391D0A13